MQIAEYKHLQDCVSAKFFSPLDHICPHDFCLLDIELPRFQKSKEQKEMLQMEVVLEYNDHTA